MSIETILLDHIKDRQAVREIFDQRIFMQHAIQAGDLPVCVLTRVDGVQQNALTGYNGLTRVRMQFDIWARTYAEAKTGAAAVQGALRSPPGCLDNGIQLSDQDLYDDELTLHRITMDWAFYVDE